MDPALQLIIDHFKAMKNDMNAGKYKIENGISVMETKINAGQAELKKKE
jgi:hypothetical protein